MRKRRNRQASMLAFVDLEERVPRHHPLRTMNGFADRALENLSPTFDTMYGSGGRPSIPPERLLKGDYGRPSRRGAGRRTTSENRSVAPVDAVVASKIAVCTIAPSR
jgi:hypothetical protein